MNKCDLNELQGVVEFFRRGEVLRKKGRCGPGEALGPAPEVVMGL